MFRRRALERRLARAIAEFPNEFLPESIPVLRSAPGVFPLRFRLANLPEKPSMSIHLEGSSQEGYFLRLSVYLTHWYDWAALGPIMEKLGPPKEFEYRITEDWTLYAECTALPEEGIAVIRKFARILGATR